MARAPLIAMAAGAGLGFAAVLLAGVLLRDLLAVAVIGSLGAVVGVLLLWFKLPRLAVAAVEAEENNGIVVLLHGDDFRVLPIAGKYYRRSNVVETIYGPRSLRFVPDPESTMAVHGQRSKVAMAYVNYPFLLNPKHVLVAHDYKRMGIENIGQLIEFEKYYRNVDKLEEEIKAYESLLEALEGAEDPSRLPAEVRKVLPPEVQTRDDLVTYRDQLKAYVNDLRRVLESVKKSKKPVVRIGARFYTVRDVLGFLAFHVRPSKLAALIETVRLEERSRLHSEWGQVAKYGVLVLMAFIGLIAFLMALNTFGHAPSVQYVPINATG